MIMPDVLIVQNYLTTSKLGLVDTILGIGLPYMGSAFGIFLLRQAFKQVPRELEDAARVEGAGWFSILLKVYVPLARPTYLAYGLVSVSYHWKNSCGRWSSPTPPPPGPSPWGFPSSARPSRGSTFRSSRPAPCSPSRRF